MMTVHSNESEMIVLGYLLGNNDSLYRITDIINQDSFFDQRHSKLYNLILELNKSGKDYDVVSIGLELQKKAIQNIDAFYLGELLSMGKYDIETHAYIIQEKYILRQLVNHANYILAESEKSPDSLELLAKSNIFLNQINNKITTSTTLTAKEWTLDVLKDIEKRRNQEKSSLATGITKIDNILQGGFERPSFNIIAGRPSNGKTTLAINIINYNTDEKVLFISCDQKASILGRRLLIQKSGLNTAKIKSVDYPIIESEFKVVCNHLSDFHKKDNIFINDRFWDIDDLYLYCISTVRRFKINYIIIDYIQQITTRIKSVETNATQLGYISQRLKELSRNLDVPVIALAQLNREVESRVSKMPILADLKASGNFEQDADSVILMYNPSFYGFNVFPKRAIIEFEGQDTKEKISMIIAKQKDGATGAVLSKYYPQYYRIVDNDREYQEQPISYYNEKDDVPF